LPQVTTLLSIAICYIILAQHKVFVQRVGKISVKEILALKQLIFGGLFILLVYMIWRAVQAVTVLQKQQQDSQLKVIDHVGFVLISLFDGLVIVTALDIQAPGWLIAVVAVGGVALGIFAITVRKRTLTMQSKQADVQGD
jgi:hypothetical protein